MPDDRPVSLAGALPTGTTVSFVPDPGVFGAQRVDREYLRALLATVRSSATVTLTTP